MQLTEYEQKAINKFGQSVTDGKWSNDGLVKLFKLIGDDFLNIKTIPNYAKHTGKSYPGVLKTKTPKILFGVKFIIDNN